MEEVFDGRTSAPIGVTGELGVRYGLQFSCVISNKVEITTVEIDDLDTKISEIDPFEGDTELLYCLINKLKEDEKFRLFSRYIFPLNKLLATLAVYNDMAFLPSIGETTVESGDSVGLGTAAAKNPGMTAAVTLNEDTQAYSVITSGVDGWMSNADRSTGPLQLTKI